VNETAQEIGVVAVWEHPFSVDAGLGMICEQFGGERLTLRASPRLEGVDRLDEGKISRTWNRGLGRGSREIGGVLRGAEHSDGQDCPQTRNPRITTTEFRRFAHRHR